MGKISREFISFLIEKTQKKLKKNKNYSKNF
jgi:hypothetical protein